MLGHGQAGDTALFQEYDVAAALAVHTPSCTLKSLDRVLS